MSILKPKDKAKSPKKVAAKKAAPKKVVIKKSPPKKVVKIAVVAPKKKVKKKTA